MAGLSNNTEAAALYMLKGMIAETPQEDQDKVADLKRKLEEVVAQNPAHGGVALTLLSLEMATDQGIFAKPQQEAA